MPFFVLIELVAVFASQRVEQKFLELVIHPTFAEAYIQDTPFLIELNQTSPGAYVNVDALFPTGLLSPNAFLTLSQQLIGIDFTHLVLHSPSVPSEVLTRFRSLDFPDFSVAGLIFPPTRFFTTSIDCTGQEELCAELSEICEKFGLSSATCLDALDLCSSGGFRGFRALKDCALNHSYGRIIFEQAYGTATSFTSIKDESPAFVVSRALVEYFALNAHDFNNKFPSIGISLGQWLAPVQDVHFIDLADYFVLVYFCWVQYIFLILAPPKSTRQ